METYFCITIDTECDHAPDWSVSNPLTFDSILLGIPNLLQPVFEEHGAIPTYLLTNEVLMHPGCVRTLAGLKGRCELGTHLHADFVEPQRRVSQFPGINPDDFQIDYPPEVEYGKLATLTESFGRAFGRPPKVFRAGRFAASADTLSSLARLGYTVDTSVTPHMEWPNKNGRKLSYVGAPDQPYFASTENINHAGGGAILEVPVTIVPSFSFPASIKRLKPSYRLDWLRPFWSSTATMKRMIDSGEGKSRDKGPRILNMMFHSMEVIPNASPYTRTQGDVGKYLESLGEVLRHARARGVKFLDLEGIRALFG